MKSTLMTLTLAAVVAGACSVSNKQGYNLIKENGTSASKQASKDPVVTVRGKRINCCGTYFSNVTGQWTVTYFDSQRKWGDQVFIHYGFKVYQLHDIPPGSGQFGTADWQFIQEEEMSAVKPYTWEIILNSQLLGRGDSQRKGELQFVFKIKHGDGSEEWQRGNTEDSDAYYQSADVFNADACIRTPPSGGACYCKIKNYAVSTQGGTKVSKPLFSDLPVDNLDLCHLQK